MAKTDNLEKEFVYERNGYAHTPRASDRSPGVDGQPATTRGVQDDNPCVSSRKFHEPKVCDRLSARDCDELWFLLAALMGPKFFARFLFFFVLGAGLFLYCLLRA
jgi:hypothetical protein